MITVDMKSTNHTFLKVNLITIIEKNRSYDIHKCEKCGLTGKSYQLGTITFDGRIKNVRATDCPMAQSVNKIRILFCSAIGKAFANLEAGSIHDIIDPPPGKDNSRGVWVMGNGEPVKVLFNEFERVNNG